MALTWITEMTCSACPVQIDIIVSNGTYGYFRYRWGGLRITLWESQDALFQGEPLAEYAESIGDHLDGWMSEDDANEIINREMPKLLEAAGA